MSKQAIEMLHELHTCAATAAANTNRPTEERAWRALQAFAAMAIDDVESDMETLREPGALATARSDFADEQATSPGLEESPVTKPERVAELERELAARDATIAELHAQLQRLAESADHSATPSA
jgi:hypothetical protein